jgi:hypothetical protein
LSLFLVTGGTLAAAAIMVLRHGRRAVGIMTEVGRHFFGRGPGAEDFEA